VESYKDLKMDPSTRTEQLLEAILLKMDNQTSPSNGLQSLPISVSASVVITNTLFFLSLCVSLLAALGAILIKQWARNFYIGLNHITSPRRRARLRYQRASAMKEYKFALITAWIPMMLHASLFLFLSGLIIWLWSLNKVLFTATSLVFGVSLVIYISGAAISSFDPNAPFVWPVATLLQKTPLHKLRVRSSIEPEEKDLPIRAYGLPKRFATPVDRFESLAHDFNQSSDPLDAVIISEFLQHADTNVEVEAALDQLRQILIVPITHIDGISSEALTSFIEKGAKLALACGVYQGEWVDTQSVVSRRFTVVMQFFEVVLQNNTLDMQGCEDLLRSVLKLIRAFHKTSMNSEALVLITLSASCLARLEALLGSDSEVLNQIIAGPTIMEKMNQLGPSPAGRRQTQHWTTDEVLHYQGLACAYMASFVELLLACDRRNLKLTKKTIDAIELDGRILLDNSRIGAIAGDHHDILEFLKSRWQAFHGPEGDHITPPLVKYFLFILGWDGIFENGVHIARPRVRPKH
jgi:hypothetical protein